MNTKLIGISIAAFIVIIVLGSVLMPILDDATTTEEKFENVGYFYMTDPTETHTYVFDGTKWTVDGEVLDHTLAGVNVIATNYLFIRDIGQVRGGVNATMKSCDLTVANGAITGTYVDGSDQTQTANWAFTTFYGATNDKASYIMSDRNNTPIAYVKGDSEVFGYGLTTLDGNQTTFQVTGNLDDGITVTCPNTSVTISNISYNVTPVEGYIDLYTFTSVTFTATLSGTDYDVTYNIVVLPSEVTAERSVHFTDGMNQLLLIIPMLVIVAILLGVIALVVRSRME